MTQELIAILAGLSHADARDSADVFWEELYVATYPPPAGYVPAREINA